MSLITLKNDDNSKPYSWRNYLREPIEIEPKSSISVVSAVVKPSLNVNMIDSIAYYWTMGSTTQLNPVCWDRIDDGVESWITTDLAVAIEEDMNIRSNQSVFCNDGNGFGWDCFVNVDKKFNFGLTQNPLPLELPIQQTWSGVPNVWYNPFAIGAGVNDYTRIRRTGAGVANPAESSCGASWAEGICPRNAGHIIFKPTPIGGGIIDRDMRFALGATYSTATGSQISYFTSPAGQASNAPFGTIGIRFVGGVGSAIAQSYINIGSLETGIETAKGLAYQTVAGSNPVFCIEWITPYSMKVKYSLNYDPAVPANDFLNAVWVDMYDMTNDPIGGGTNIQFPTYLDNFSPMVQMRGANNQVEVRGTLTNNFDEAGKWDWTELGFARTDPRLQYRFNIPEGTDAFVGAYPNCFLNKEIKILGDTIEVGFTEADYTEWRYGLVGNIENTEFLKRLGFTPPIIKLVNDGPSFQSYSLEATNTPVVGNYIPTLHIQLTNLAVKSKNGIVSNNVKDIAVIPLFDATPDDDFLRFLAPYENRVNLNNLEKLNLNELDILITTDENTPATFLTHHTAVVLKIHKGEV